MSKRRQPGEIVRRQPGSGFIGSDVPSFIQVPEGKAYENDCVKDENGEWKVNPGGEATVCMYQCGDDECREWANLKIVGGPYDGDYIYHVSECEMFDLEPGDKPEENQ